MISKKDLLKETNISYGQLYRWKREGLIPDEWFIKQAVTTGQETFFVRSQIITRINKILQLKDQYPLEQLKAFFNPDISKQSFSLKDVILIDQIDPYVLKKYAKDKTEFTIYELIMVYLFSTYQEYLSIDDYLSIDFSKINSIHKTAYLIKGDKDIFLILGEDDAFIDPHLTIIKKIKFEEISSLIAQKLK